MIFYFFTLIFAYFDLFSIIHCQRNSTFLIQTGPEIPDSGMETGCYAWVLEGECTSYLPGAVATNILLRWHSRHWKSEGCIHSDSERSIHTLTAVPVTHVSAVSVSPCIQNGLFQPQSSICTSPHHANKGCTAFIWSFSQQRVGEGEEGVWVCSEQPLWS